MSAGSSGGLHRLPLGKTRSDGATDESQGREVTPEWGLKNEAPARAYSVRPRADRTVAPGLGEADG
jgi:hypothetical protein